MKRKIYILALAFAVLVGGFILPPEVSAGTTVGGVLYTDDSKTNIENLLGNKAQVTISGDNLTISLTDNIQLTQPLDLYARGNKKIVSIYLNGHKILGVNGNVDTKSTDMDALRLHGESTLHIYGGDFSTVNNNGAIVGGSAPSGSYELSGAGINFIENLASSLSELPLISINNGANIIGGKGGDSTDVNTNGGHGGYGLLDSSAHRVDNSKASFFKVTVKNGLISGGEGGSLNLADKITVSHWYPTLDGGQGGIGLSVGEGRKYLNVEVQGKISGGKGGGCNLSKDSIFYGYGGKGGEGIEIGGDMGDDNTNSPSMEIYGSVKGGDAPDTTGKYATAASGGDAIGIYSYNTNLAGPGDYDSTLPKIMIHEGGLVAGGDGGESQIGPSGSGGIGICKDSNGTYNSLTGIVVDGTLSGGNGGDSTCAGQGINIVDDTPQYLSSGGSAGLGGRGLDTTWDTLSIRGSGTIKGGNCGKAILGLGESSHASENIYNGVSFRTISQDSLDGFNGTISSGNPIVYLPQPSNNSKATISMSGFNSTTPVAGNTLSCTLTGIDPAYQGEIFYDWRCDRQGFYGNAGIDMDPVLQGVNNQCTFSQSFINSKHSAQDYKIYCIVALENGVSFKSNVINFDGRTSLAPPLSLTAVPYATGQIKITWPKSTTAYNDTFKYTILRSTTGASGSFTRLSDSGASTPGNKVEVGTDTVTYIDKTCNVGATYYYIVELSILKSKVGNTETWSNGSSSNPVSCTAKAMGTDPTPPSVTPPAKPTSLGVALKTSYLGIGATWKASPGATGYQVRIKGAGSSTYSYYDTTSTRFYKKMAKAGSKYYVWVRAYKTVDGVKYYSSYTASKYAYTLKAPTIKLKRTSSKYVKISWSSISGESGYRVYRSTKKTSSFKFNKSVSYKYTSASIYAKKSKTYYFKVRAYKTVDGKRIYGPYSTVKYIKASK